VLTLTQANSFRMLQIFEVFGYLSSAMIYLVSNLKATVESNLEHHKGKALYA